MNEADAGRRNRADGDGGIDMMNTRYGDDGGGMNGADRGKRNGAVVGRKNGAVVGRNNGAI